MWWVTCISSVHMMYVQEYIEGQPNPLLIEQPMKKQSFTTLPHPRHQLSLDHPALHLAITPLPTAEPGPLFRCQTNGLAMLYQYVVLESG